MVVRVGVFVVTSVNEFDMGEGAEGGVVERRVVEGGVVEGGVVEEGDVGEAMDVGAAIERG